jgi:hypothetical protein
MSGLQRVGALASDVERDRLNLKLPTHVQYACLYWVDHLRQAGHIQQENIGLCDNGRVHLFFQTHFLHWLEALSLVERCPKEC